MNEKEFRDEQLNRNINLQIETGRQYLERETRKEYLDGVRERKWDDSIERGMVN